MSKTATDRPAFLLILQILGGTFVLFSMYNLHFAAQLEMLMFQYRKY